MKEIFLLILLTGMTALSSCTKKQVSSPSESAENRTLDIGPFSKSLGLESFDCGANIKVALTPYKQCGMGDGDAIIKDIGDDFSRSVIIRLESLRDWNHGFSGKVDNRSLLEKKTQVVQIASASGSDKKFNLYGFFICNDEEKLGVCGNKHLIDQSTLNYSASMSTKSQRAKTDKIYFFKLVLRSGNTCYFSNRNDGGFLNDSIEQYQKMLTSPSMPYLEKTLNYALKYEKTLTNFPLANSNGTLVVKVPFEHKEGKCDF